MGMGVIKDDYYLHCCETPVQIVFIHRNGIEKVNCVVDSTTNKRFT